MLILIEGPDGSGKSSLVENLLKQDSNLQKGFVDRLGNISDEYIHYRNEKSTFLFDRSFITEMVYRLEDGKFVKSFDLFKLVSNLRGECKIVFCNNENAFYDAMTRGEDNITSKNRHERISLLYDDMYRILENYSDVPVMKYDWRNCTIDEVINFIKGG